MKVDGTILKIGIFARSATKNQLNDIQDIINSLKFLFNENEYNYIYLSAVIPWESIRNVKLSKLMSESLKKITNIQSKVWLITCYY